MLRILAIVGSSVEFIIAESKETLTHTYIHPQRRHILTIRDAHMLAGVTRKRHNTTTTTQMRHTNRPSVWTHSVLFLVRENATYQLDSTLDGCVRGLWLLQDSNDLFQSHLLWLPRHDWNNISFDGIRAKWCVFVVVLFTLIFPTNS